MIKTIERTLPVDHYLRKTKYIKIINGDDNDVNIIKTALKDNNVIIESHDFLLSLFFTDHAEEQIHEYCHTETKMSLEDAYKMINEHRGRLACCFMDGHVPLDDQGNMGEITKEYMDSILKK